MSLNLLKKVEHGDTGDDGGGVDVIVDGVDVIV